MTNQIHRTGTGCNRRIGALGKALLLIGFGCLAAMVLGADGDTPPQPSVSTSTPVKQPSVAVVPEPKDVGGEPDGIVQVANLIYAGTKSSTCFSDHFLIRAEKDSSISTSRRFHSVKLSSDELFEFPLVIMTGEGNFELPDAERQNLRKFVEGGGLLLASASCSSPDWDRSFRSEMATIFPDHPLAAVPMTHPVFHTVYDVNSLQGSHGPVRPLEGVTVNERLGIIYSCDGLNDTAHTQGCCCCGGNEIINDEQINVDILAYSLIY